MFTDENEIENTDQSTQESFGVDGGDNEQDNTPAINPAWKEALDQIPEEFHPALTPKLSNWDKNFQEVQQRYAPYKEFVENQIPVETIQQSMQIRDLLESNPRGVFDFLQKTYNFGNEAAPTGPKGNEEEEYNFDEDEIDLEKHPKFQAMAEKLNHFESFMEAQREQETAQQVQISIENDFKAIAQKYAGGNLDDQSKADIARLAMGAGDHDLHKAAEDYFTRFKSAPRNPAPPVLRGNGRVPAGITLDDVAAMDSEQRIAHVAAMMKATLEAN